MKIKRTQKMKPFRVYFPIERVDEKERIAEGYAFVNEVVEGEGGVRLRRTAMQKATEGYMKWGAVREMHEAKAAGTALQVKWDDKGALLRAKIVDDDAWKKVQAGVYKGFSVGVRAKQMRGLNVEQADWIETSLVDRPADPDAVISLVRATTDTGGEADVEILDDPTDVKSLKKEIKRLQKEIVSLKEKASQGGGADIQRLTTDNATLVKRVEGLETELKTTKAERKAARKEIKRLLAQPASIPPVRYPSAFNREFSANEGRDGADTELEASLKEFNELKDKLATEPDAEKRHKGAVRLNFLKGGLSAAGLNV